MRQERKTHCTEALALRSFRPREGDFSGPLETLLDLMGKSPKVLPQFSPRVGGPLERIRITNGMRNRQSWVVLCGKSYILLYHSTQYWTLSNRNLPPARESISVIGIAQDYE